MKTKTYFLHSGGKEINVGTKAPYYDAQTQGWVTEKGIFSTPNAADYTVTVKLAETKTA